MAGPIRQAIDVERLSSYLAWHVPAIQLPVVISQFKYGQSNPTYLLEANNSRYVLRKKPPGSLLSKTAHQVEREFRVLSALQGSNVPVPRVYSLCLDSSVIGSPFYIMEYLDGRIFADPAIPNVDPEQRRQMWQCAMEVLGALHSIRPDTLDLSGFGKDGGFYDRQLRTLGAISASQASTLDVETEEPVGDMPHADEIMSFLASRDTQPRDRSCLVHGDFKIDNLVFHKTESKVIGVLDWEMSTIGHPLSDVSNVLSPYIIAMAPSDSGMQMHRNPAFMSGSLWPGLLSREQCLATYAHSGWDASGDLDWGAIFATFRNGVIMQGIAARSAQRQASSEQAARFAEMMAPNGEFCWDLIQRYLHSRHDSGPGPRL